MRWPLGCLLTWKFWVLSGWSAIFPVSSCVGPFSPRSLSLPRKILCYIHGWDQACYISSVLANWFLVTRKASINNIERKNFSKHLTQFYSIHPIGNIIFFAHIISLIVCSRYNYHSPIFQMRKLSLIVRLWKWGLHADLLDFKAHALNQWAIYLGVRRPESECQVGCLTQEKLTFIEC